MRQLLNHHPVDTKPGEIGLTVRRSIKWAGIQTGELFELHQGTGPDDQKRIGTGEALEIWVGKYRDLPARLIEIEHEEASRHYSGLLASMRRAYGEGFSEDQEVTAFSYKRHD